MIALALALVAAQAVEPTREERVLELVERIERQGSFWYSSAGFARGPAPIGKGTVVVPRVFQICGSYESRFDADRARDLGAELAGIFGSSVQRDRGVAGGFVLDALDPAARIGFELRDPDDRDGADLHGDAFASLAAAGHRVHVADVRSYRILSEDDLTTALAWLAGLVEFLNAVTVGEDVELGGLLFERESSWSWPVDEWLGRHSDLEVTERGVGNLAHHFELSVERKTELVLPCAGLTDFDPPPFSSCAGDAPGTRCIESSTRGAPSVLLARAIPRVPRGAQPPAVRLRLRQGELFRESDRLVLFLPSEFDLAEPFVLELELAPGRYSFHGPARLGAADLARERKAPAPR